MESLALNKCMESSGKIGETVHGESNLQVEESGDDGNKVLSNTVVKSTILVTEDPDIIGSYFTCVSHDDVEVVIRRVMD